VFLLDAGKGAAAVLIARALSPEAAVYPLAAGLAVLVGHSFPVFLGFRGGKGAATGVGVLIPLAGWLTLIVVFLFAAAVAATRYVSLGSIIGALSLPLLFWLFPGFSSLYVWFGAAMALLVVLRHHANIGRLLKGTESKFGQKVKRPEEGAS